MTIEEITKKINSIAESLSKNENGIMFCIYGVNTTGGMEVMINCVNPFGGLDDYVNAINSVMEIEPDIAKVILQSASDFGRRRSNFNLTPQGEA